MGQRLLKAAIGAVFSGLLLTLALPLGEQGYLAAFALIPVLASVRNTRFIIGFLAGLLTILVAAEVAKSGIFYAHPRSGGTQGWIYTGMFLFGFGLASLTALYAEPKLSTKPAWWFAAVGTLLEAVLLTQIPGHLALTQYRHSLFMGLASFGGIWAVSFFLYYANLKLLDVNRRFALVFAASFVAVWFITRPFLSAPEGKLTRVAALQTEAIDAEALREQHLKVQNAAFVVWPEFSGLALAFGGNTKELETIAKAPGATPFITTFRDTAQPMPHNIAQAFDKSGPLGKPYAKRKPFASERQMHAAGRQPGQVTIGKLHVGLNICFDSCFASVIGDTADQYVQIIALPTIDPPSPHHFLAAMHAAYTPFRAAETGLPIVRADGSAYSMIVRGDGKIVAEAAPGESVLIAEVPVPEVPNAMRPGNNFLVVCAGMFLWGFRKPKKKPEGANAPPGIMTLLSQLPWGGKDHKGP